MQPYDVAMMLTTRNVTMMLTTISRIRRIRRKRDHMDIKMKGNGYKEDRRPYDGS